MKVPTYYSPTAIDHTASARNFATWKCSQISRSSPCQNYKKPWQLFSHICTLPRTFFLLSTRNYKFQNNLCFSHNLSFTISFVSLRPNYFNTDIFFYRKYFRFVYLWPPQYTTFHFNMERRKTFLSVCILNFSGMKQELEGKYLVTLNMQQPVNP